MDILFNVQNQTLTRTDSNAIIGDSKNYLTARFTFSTEWAGLAKTAQFTKDKTTYDMLLVDDVCLVPWEVLTGSGVIWVNVFAGNLITVNACSFPVRVSGLKTGQVPEAATPDIYAQILATVAVERLQAASAAILANNAATAADTATDAADLAASAATAAAAAAADAAAAATGAIAEVVAARGGQVNLDTRLDLVDTQLAQKVTSSRQLKYWNRPAAYKIKVAAGRFNMSWNNANGRRWIFPVGTVLYSDGTTPIRTSTAEKPDVTIPAGGGYIWLASAMWNGLYSLTDNDTNTLITGALADLPPLTYWLDLASCSLITGALADLPPLTYYLSLYYCQLITGALADLPPLTYYLSLANCSLITGALADLPPLTYWLSLYNCSLITGALADLPPLTSYLSLYKCQLITGTLADLPPLTYLLDLTNCSLITGVYSAVSGDNVPTVTTLTGTGLSTADMDATLIAYAATTKSSGTFTATGKTRTAASDAAVATLLGRSWTINGITKV